MKLHVLPTATVSGRAFISHLHTVGFQPLDEFVHGLQDDGVRRERRMHELRGVVRRKTCPEIHDP